MLLASRLRVDVPLSVRVMAVLNSGRVWVVCCPRVWIGSGTLALFYSLSYCPVPLLSLCLLSQHCWFRVVSLWQGCVIVG